MKKILVFVFSAFIVVITFAQAPDKINYQAVIRNVSGVVFPNQLIGMKISIIQGSLSGSVVFAETHNVETNSYGLVNILMQILTLFMTHH